MDATVETHENTRLRSISRIGLVAATLVLVAALAVFVGPRVALIVLVGLGIGILFESFGFGFAGPWRRMILHRDPSGIFAQFLAIGLVAVFALPLLAYAPQELIGAHAPVGFSMVGGAFVFGICMQIILGCGSGTLVNAGSGNLIAVVALPFFAIGSFAGAYSLFEWTALGSLPTITASGGTGVVYTLIGLAALSLIFYIFSDREKAHLPKRLIIVAFLLAVLAVLHLVIAGQPWGVVYGLGLWAAKGISALGIGLEGSAFWTSPTHATRLSESILTDVTSLTNLGLIGGAALVVSWKQGLSKPVAALPVKAWIFVIIAGFLLGYSSRLAFGCNVGAFFSGISTGSLHGWAWFIAAFAGSVVGVKIRPSLGLEAK